MNKRRAVTITIRGEKFRVSPEIARTIFALACGSIPWRVPVQDLIDKYTEPGVVLRGARGKEGLTRKEMAKRLKMPVADIIGMESGRRPIDRKMAVRFSNILKIDHRIFL